MQLIFYTLLNDMFTIETKLSIIKVLKTVC